MAKNLSVPAGFVISCVRRATKEAYWVGEGFTYVNRVYLAKVFSMRKLAAEHIQLLKAEKQTQGFTKFEVVKPF